MLISLIVRLADFKNLANKEQTIKVLQDLFDGYEYQDHNGATVQAKDKAAAIVGEVIKCHEEQGKNEIEFYHGARLFIHVTGFLKVLENDGMKNAKQRLEISGTGSYMGGGLLEHVKKKVAEKYPDQLLGFDETMNFQRFFPHLYNIITKRDISVLLKNHYSYRIDSKIEQIKKELQNASEEEKHALKQELKQRIFQRDEYARELWNSEHKDELLKKGCFSDEFVNDVNNGLSDAEKDEIITRNKEIREAKERQEKEENDENEKMERERKQKESLIEEEKEALNDEINRIQNVIDELKTEQECQSKKQEIEKDIENLKTYNNFARELYNEKLFPKNDERVIKNQIDCLLNRYLAQKFSLIEAQNLKEQNAQKKREIEIKEHELKNPQSSTQPFVAKEDVMDFDSRPHTGKILLPEFNKKSHQSSNPVSKLKDELKNPQSSTQPFVAKEDVMDFDSRPHTGKILLPEFNKKSHQSSNPVSSATDLSTSSDSSSPSTKKHSLPENKQLKQPIWPRMKMWKKILLIALAVLTVGIVALVVILPIKRIDHFRQAEIDKASQSNQSQSSDAKKVEVVDKVAGQDVDHHKDVSPNMEKISQGFSSKIIMSAGEETQGHER